MCAAPWAHNLSGAAHNRDPVRDDGGWRPSGRRGHEGSSEVDEVDDPDHALLELRTDPVRLHVDLMRQYHRVLGDDDDVAPWGDRRRHGSW